MAIKKENKPTREQLWEELIREHKENVDHAWKAGYYYGLIEGISTSNEIEIKDLIEGAE